MFPWAWQEVEGELEAVSVDEIDYHGTTVGICWQQGREEGGEDVEWVWLCGGCVAPPIQEIRLAVVWAVLYSGLDECVCSHDGHVDAVC